jgi:hypothetical protein
MEVIAPDYLRIAGSKSKRPFPLSLERHRRWATSIEERMISVRIFAAAMVAMKRVSIAPPDPAA